MQSTEHHRGEGEGYHRCFTALVSSSVLPPCPTPGEVESRANWILGS